MGNELFSRSTFITVIHISPHVSIMSILYLCSFVKVYKTKNERK